MNDKKYFSRIFFICVILAGLIAGYSYCAAKKVRSKDAKKTSVSAEKWGNAPDFTFKKVGGEKFTLSSLKGKVIILDFFATWCPPCRQEIPDFIQLKKDYEKKGLEIVGISLDKSESTVKEFYDKNGMNYIVVMGNNDIGDKYGGVSGIPTTFIIDRKGDIVNKHIGFTTKEDFELEIKKLF